MNAAIEAKLSEIKAAVDAEKAEVKAAIDALAAEIADLKAKVEAGVDPAEVLAGLDSIESGVKAIYEVPVAPPVE